MAVSLVFRNLSSDPVASLSDPLTLADASPGASPFSGIDVPSRTHLTGATSLSSTRQAVYVPLALAAGQEVKLDIDFSPGNLRVYVLDADGNIVAENDDGGAIDNGSPGLLDPNLTFAPATGGVFFIIVTSFDNQYLGNWQFENDGTVNGSFQLDISAARLPLRQLLGNDSNDFFGNVGTAYRMQGRDGHDRMWYFGVNDDHITGGAGDDDLDGGPGNDVLAGGLDNDYIKGGLGNDVLSGGRGMDSLAGGDGEDELHGGADADYDFLSGGNGNDRIFSGRTDFVLGDAGNDTLTGDAESQDGGADNDSLTGGSSANTLTGGAGNDVIQGLGGNDTIIGGLGDDGIDGGAGVDTVYFDQAGPGVTVDLTGGGTATGQGTDTITGVERMFGTNNKDTLGGDDTNNTFFGMGDDDIIGGVGGNDNLFGDDGEDLLFGGDGDDTIQGNQHDDHLAGEAGRDRLIGGEGSDLLRGGTGRDILTGGSGKDRFVFASKAEAGLPGSNSDLITDFLQSEIDKIFVGAIDSNEIDGISNLDDPGFDFIGMELFSGKAGELHFLFDGGDTRIEGDTTGDGVADFEITLRGQITLVANDFFL